MIWIVLSFLWIGVAVAWLERYREIRREEELGAGGPDDGLGGRDADGYRGRHRAAIPEEAA